jgi:hypothetical protein
MFVTAPYEPTSGIIAVNRKGQVKVFLDRRKNMTMFDILFSKGSFG